MWFNIFKGKKEKRPYISHPINHRTWDNSTKEFEIDVKVYRWNKATRELECEPKWRHHRYYKTLEGAKDALRAFRRSSYKESIPWVGQEHRFPHIEPYYRLERFRIVKREL